MFRDQNDRRLINYHELLNFNIFDHSNRSNKWHSIDETADSVKRDPENIFQIGGIIISTGPVHSFHCPTCRILDIPEFYWRSRERGRAPSRARTHVSPLFGPAGQRGEKGKRQGPYLPIGNAIPHERFLFLLWCTRVRPSSDTLRPLEPSSRQNEIVKITRVSPLAPPFPCRGFKSCRKQGENIGFEIRNFFRVHCFRGGI